MPIYKVSSKSEPVHSDVRKYAKIIAESENTSYESVLEQIFSRFTHMVIAKKSDKITGGAGVVVKEYNDIVWFGVGKFYAIEKGLGNTGIPMNCWRLVFELYRSTKKQIKIFGLFNSPISYAKCRRLGFVKNEATLDAASFFAELYYNNQTKYTPSHFSNFAFDTFPRMQYIGPTNFDLSSKYVKEFFSIIPKEMIGPYSIPMSLDVTLTTIVLFPIRVISSFIRRRVLIFLKKKICNQDFKASEHLQKKDFLKERIVP